MVNTKRFSEFSAANLTTDTKKMAGISTSSGGENIIVDFTVKWTTAGRPTPPYNGLFGYNTDLDQYEYYDTSAAAWVQLASNTVFDDAKFILQQPDASLPSAQALSDLTTGILKSTTVTGVLSISAPLTSIDSLTTIANEMLYTTGVNTYAVTALTAFARTLLDDASASAMRTTLGLGEAAVKDVTDNGEPLVASVTGSFIPGNVLLAADTFGTVVDGGSPSGMGTVTEVDTGTGLTGGPITTTGAISFASIAANSLWVNNTGGVAVPAVTSLAALTKVDDTNVTLALGGTPATALINAVSLTLGWTGTLAETRGGTGQSTYILGDILYASAANTLSKLAGNVTSGKQFLSQTGTGAVSAAPAWVTLSGGDIPGAALTKTDDTNVTLTLGGSPSTALLNATSLTLGWTGTLSPTRGGTGVSDPTAHGIMIAEGASAMTPIVLSSGQILVGSTGVDPVAAAINSGSGILVANGAGSITVSLAAIADHTLLANISGGSLAPSSTTLTALIDNAIGSTQGNILYRNATVWTVLAPGTSGQLLSTGGAAANPAWTTTTFPATGGPAGNILISNGTNYIASTSLWPNTVGTAGTILRSNGTSNAYSTSTFADTYAVSTILYASGTNAVSGLATANSSVLVTTSAGVPVQSGTMTDGQLIIGSTGATPVVASLTAGAGISITPGAGSISIASTGIGSFTWNDVAGTSQAAAVNNGYIISNASLTTVTLPATAAVGSVFGIAGKGAGGWVLQMNTGQICHLNSGATSSAGSIASTNQWNAIQIVCVTANTTFTVMNSSGSLTLV